MIVRIGRLGLVAALLGLAAASSVARADDAGPPRRAAIREQMRRLLEVRLKADVGLTDAQVAGVLPEIEAIEASRRASQRERLRLLGELRRGVNAGASDEALQRSLDDLDRNERDIERVTREGLARIDAELAVPQRVRLRFLLARFRTEMTRRVDDLRQGGRGPR